MVKGRFLTTVQSVKTLRPNPVDILSHNACVFRFYIYRMCAYATYTSMSAYIFSLGEPSSQSVTSYQMRLCSI